ncbi:hypothetical protein DMJ13_19115 [halophilic archaeon]|nr:hypothetical protein DMJ13_19115 [halophilic archaeon]
MFFDGLFDNLAECHVWFDFGVFDYDVVALVGLRVEGIDFPLYQFPRLRPYFGYRIFANSL